MSKSKSCLSIEEYLDFLDSHSDKDRIQRLTVNSLRQIISMHGFKRIQGTKNVLIEAVEAIDPVTPWRSTLGETGVMPPPSALIGKKEIVADLEELNWQECCVTSLRTLKAKSKSKSKPKPKRKSLSHLMGP